MELICIIMQTIYYNKGKQINQDYIMNNSPIIELDLHGKSRQDALLCINKTLSQACQSVYLIRLVHGYHGGTQIRDMILEEYGYGRYPGILKIRPGSNPGITELILRDLF